ncbi:NAD(P)-dependent oxidoreductase [Falsihalocynthiibacter arcticus]|uniref:D-isomer specific 2-hydroxyacid dehydrogenase NAD-binding domain-containing protein n=1 Tax=Falsihalocynthiibacter arcticus TaxID=1579316 RepID=A0A126UYA8_9RHOB|nr:NAD(P)-dependent oxidoreductase [Falsihalocynthiibacter arcticus]AML50419.1 hypothetical protein RC74_03300 [Falsihalocynthiibacter arcticus]
MTDKYRPTRVLIADLIGLSFGPDGTADPTQARTYIEAQEGCSFEFGHVADPKNGLPNPARVIFYYCPDVSTEAELLALAGGDVYDALITAATFIPADCNFALGGVRIGAGTGNMGSSSWGGPNGQGGVAPLMNTPGINSRATAQMVWKALMMALPNLPFNELHTQVADGRFDTGRNLRDFPTKKLEGQKLAVIGYGNIGREVAKLGRAFHMDVSVFARGRHREWIESEGFFYAETLEAAARDAIALSVHLGLGPIDEHRGIPANTGIIADRVLSAMAHGSVLINFDRGELVNTIALANAMESGRIAHAIIDADVFVDEGNGAISGPMAPYLPLLEAFGKQLCLLPHAAADTDHPTRVAGAKQAVDQILAVIRTKTVINTVGELPGGFKQGGIRVPTGIGGVTVATLAELQRSGEFEKIRLAIAEIEGCLAEFGKGNEAVAYKLMLQINRIEQALNSTGLGGPLR